MSSALVAAPWCTHEETYCYRRGECADGNDPDECPNRLRSASAAPAPSAAAEPDAGELTIPWSGLALDLDRAALVAATGRPRVIALVGASEAGKTTVLARMFSRLHRHRLGSWRFGGSFTLLRWHAIAALEYPQRTTQAAREVPELLHLRLVRDGRVADIYFPDIPGEIMTRWAVKEQAPQAQWVREHADAFVLVSDTARLSSEEGRGSAVNMYRQLAERVNKEARDRRVPVWALRTMADLPIPEGIRDQIDRINAGISVQTAPVSVNRRDMHPADKLREIIDALHHPTLDARLSPSDPAAAS